MTIAATYSKIVSLAAGTSGIGLAPETLPSSLPLDGLPIVLTRVGSASWNEHASGLYRQVRTYYVDCYVQPVAEGIEPDEGYKACLTPLYNLGRTFVQNWTLENTVDQIGVGDRPEFEDSGVRSDMGYAGTAYHGFTITLQITEKST